MHFGLVVEQSVKKFPDFITNRARIDRKFLSKLGIEEYFSPGCGLYLCGASTLSHSVAGVTQSGIDAAKAALNCHTADLMTQSGGGMTFLPSEDLSAWPADLRKKIERGEAPWADEKMEV